MELVGARATRWRGGRWAVATSVGLLMTALAGALMVGACGTVETQRGSGATPGAGSSVKIVAYSTSTDSGPNAPRQPLTISATCPAGEQMVGGGFAATDVFEYAAVITAGYP